MNRTMARPVLVLPGVEDITRRDFLIGGAAALLLGGCGSGENGGEAPGETRAVRHALGTSEVPVNPKRVVSLHDSYLLDVLVALEVEPVAAAAWSPGDPRWQWPTHLEGRSDLEETRSIGTSDDPNLERLASLEPDLILGLEVEGHGDLYDRLSQIAPTVIIEDSYPEITPGLLAAGGAVGREDRAEELVAEYERVAAEIRRSVEAREDLGGVSVFRFVEEGYETQAPDRWVGQVLEDAGVPRPPSQRGESRTVSLERLDLIDGDVMVVFSALDDADDPAAVRSRILEDPLYSKLKAVRNGEVYAVGEHWNSSGFLWARLLQDDLREILAEGRQPATA